MERALQKLAKQLNQYDAASLTSLWDQYARQVARFEPTQRWEEAALVFSMIQAVHWKNQLFNAEMLNSQHRPELANRDNQSDQQLKNRLKAYAGGQGKSAPGKPEGASREGGSVEAPAGGSKGKQRRKVLLFKARGVRES